MVKIIEPPKSTNADVTAFCQKQVTFSVHLKDIVNCLVQLIGGEVQMIRAEIPNPGIADRVIELAKSVKARGHSPAIFSKRSNVAHRCNHPVNMRRLGLCSRSADRSRMAALAPFLLH